jgi:hypothetical protein
MPHMYEVTSDDYCISDGKSLVTEDAHPSSQSQTPHKLRESYQLNLLPQLVQANVGEFIPCHEEWPIPYPNKISFEAKVCTTSR